MSTIINGLTDQVSEWNYISRKIYINPFNEILLDVIITHEDGNSWIVPTFWAGEQEWKVRFSPPKQGSYEAVSRCSDTNDLQLHEVRTTLYISKYESDNQRYKHGPLQISNSKHKFEYADGTPFFWLADTWWMGLSKRLSWPEDFQLLSTDRAKKGFTVIQIVAGLLPDMDSFDERGANEAGFPWEKNYSTINPAYFDMADQRIKCLIDSGLMPCILGSWGYYLLKMGIGKMKQHWRYLVARWGAYPVVWCLAGEVSMPYYLSENRNAESEQLREGWTQIGHYIKKIDPYSRLLTVHPSYMGCDELTDDTMMDFKMIQTGHAGVESVKNTIKTISSELKREPNMPVVVGEVNYEGILRSNYADIQRLTFWVSIISGASGFTYGANGIWQVNKYSEPFGNSPNGGNWGGTPWKDAYRFNGSEQIGLAVKLLQKFDWWDFTFHPEWISFSGDQNNINAPFVMGIPAKVRIVYCYGPSLLWENRPLNILHIESNINYNAYFWNPRNGKKQDIGLVEPNTNDEWSIPVPHIFQDWVLILEV